MRSVIPTLPITALALLAAPAVAQQAPAQSVQRPTQQVALPGVASAKPAAGPGEVAKRAPINGVLVLYGNERCPTNTDGDEIVVCERRSAQEKYRVPKELREFAVTPENESWAARATGTLDVAQGVDTIGSCSAVGAGGALGCFGRQAKVARAEKKAATAAEPKLP